MLMHAVKGGVKVLLYTFLTSSLCGSGGQLHTLATLSKEKETAVSFL